MSLDAFAAMDGGRRELPPVARTLGFALESVDDSGVTCTFRAQPEFANLLGNVQGGFLTAMLDMAMSCALLAQLPADHLAPTLEMKTSYLRPAAIGTVVGRGRVLHRGSSVAFLAGELEDASGAVLVSGSATAKIIRRR